MDGVLTYPGSTSIEPVAAPVVACGAACVGVDDAHRGVLVAECAGEARYGPDTTWRANATATSRLVASGTPSSITAADTYEPRPYATRVDRLSDHAAHCPTPAIAVRPRPRRANREMPRIPRTQPALFANEVSPSRRTNT